MPQPGDRVKIATQQKTYDGFFMPSLNPKIVVIKLSSGYNAGFKRDEIKKITVLKKYVPTPKKHILPQSEGQPIIAILHTGGTIASRVSYETGGVVAQFTPEDLLVQFPELAKCATLRSRLVANMMSENMRFAHYNILAKEVIAEWKAGATGIIITHGTDTMHFTAAALSFLLPRVPVSVLLVGAQRSSDRGSTDAAQNLLAAVQFITQTDYAVLGICMHKTIEDNACVILPALRTRKVHTSRRDAFQAVDSSPLAEIVIGGNIKANKDIPKRNSVWEQNFRPFDEKIRVGVLPMHTNMYASEFLTYKGFDGLLLLGTGLGHCPIITFDAHTKEHNAILNSIKSLAKKSVVAIASQTGHGRINMDVYSPGRMLIDAGVIGNLHDMPWETAFIKLAWLLSHYPKKEAKRLFSLNLVGEITPISALNEIT